MDKPSWQTSTLSQVFFGASLIYGALFIILAIGVCFKLPLEMAEKIIALYGVPWMTITSAYLTGRKPPTNGGNGHASPPVVPTP